VHPRLAAPGAAPAELDEVSTAEDLATDRPWDVIVWDDPVNLMSYVVFVFRRIFSFPEAVARKLMLEVHNNGRALVASEPREQAEYYVQQLHAYGLHATMERSS
jgi:ATP-dependent Clp protease adaptor protein ClpS